MNKEQIINESYENYCKHFTGYDDIPKIDWFIQEIKTSKEFSERWGLKIEERELSLDERRKIVLEGDPYGIQSTDNWTQQQLEDCKKQLDEWNIPTKLITITYNNETIEIYEY
jgi:hypothetical protein